VFGKTSFGKTLGTTLQAFIGWDSGVFDILFTNPGPKIGAWELTTDSSILISNPIQVLYCLEMVTAFNPLGSERKGRAKGVMLEI